MASLHSHSDPKLVLVPATPAQVRLTWHRTGIEWGKGLTLDQYLDREVMLQATDFAQSHMTVYVLVPDNDRETREPLAHCDVFERPAVHIQGPPVSGSTADPPNHHPEGKTVVQSGLAYSIASVFCPPAYRGWGYASMMMDQLYTILKTKPNSLASTLYSDIGPDFYARFGWRTYPAQQIEITVPGGPVSDISMSPYLSSSPTEAVALFLDSHTAKPLLTRHCDRVKQILTQFSAKPTTNYVCVLPTVAAFEWHWARAKYLGPILAGRQPTHVGAVIPAPASPPSAPSFITWFHDYENRELLILHAWINEPAAVGPLLHKAVQEAQQNGLTKVTSWLIHDPPESPLRQCAIQLDQVPAYFKAQVGERKSSLPALADYVTPEKGGREQQQQPSSSCPCEWLIDDRLAWV
ncbi:hypothetical protein H4R33_004055 [Dimargaris cristalligena]|nr:hypothetical protein H4R33_004055 [Dimargaris cristalligena]